MARRRLTGIIVSAKMGKTVVVEVERIKQHARYARRIRVHKRYKAHDEESQYHTGDTVIIEETRPLSRDKRWRVMKKV